MRLTIAPRDTPRILESGNQMPVRPGAIDNRRCSFMAVMTPGLAQVRFNHLRVPEYLPPFKSHRICRLRALRSHPAVEDLGSTWASSFRTSANAVS